VIDTVRRFVKNAGVFECGLQTMSNLIRKEESAHSENSARVHFAKKGAIPVLVEGMKEHISVAIVQKAGLVALRSFASNASNISIIVSQGGLEAALASMKTHSKLKNIQLEGMEFLQNFALTAGEATNNRLGELGGLQAVLDAWAAYPELQSSALWSFSQVLGAIKNTTLFGELGAIPKIIQVYKDNKADDDIQEACLEIFALLARLPTNKMMFCETGVVEQAIASIQKYTTDNKEEDVSGAGDTVLTAGLEFLAQVATNDAKAQRFIGSKKGVKAILGALETFSTVSSITEKACFAIQALSDDETNLKKLNKVRKEKPDLIQLSHSTSFILCKACGRGDFPSCPDNHGLLTDYVDAKVENVGAANVEK